MDVMLGEMQILMVRSLRRRRRVPKTRLRPNNEKELNFG